MALCEGIGTRVRLIRIVFTQQSSVLLPLRLFDQLVDEVKKECRDDE